MFKIDGLRLRQIAPSAQVVYLEAFDQSAEPLVACGVAEARLRLEHFLAQGLHETLGLRVLVENLSYSVERLREVWPKRFPTAESAQPFAGNPRALANLVYGHRLGNADENDGWRFLGRGLFQLTGKANYARLGAKLGLDLVASPALALAPENILRIACQFWSDAGCNAEADADSLEGVTEKINGGLTGLEMRRLWLARVRAESVIVPLEGGS